MFKEFPKHILSPSHGGKLKQAIQQGEFSGDQWLDLSTGINPNPWPVPPLTQKLLHRLPEDSEALNQAANRFYRQNHTHDRHTPIAIPGSQWLIQHLPNICQSAATKPLKKILVPKIGFSEHAFWWQQQHDIQHYCDNEIKEVLESSEISADVVVIINPNNPTTTLTCSQAIVKAAQQNNHSLFIVDEAFMDCQPEKSILNYDLPDNIIVLRSLGKFFGLAGIRLGFAFVPQSLLAWIKYHLGPWPIATMTLWIGEQALVDTQWHTHTRKKLIAKCEALTRIVKTHIRESEWASKAFQVNSSHLFITIDCGDPKSAKRLHSNFLRTAILTRLVEQSSLVRLGFPTNDSLSDFEQRLEAVFTDH
ncbi:MAG: aminotransferase class I/II-fold pyridoxal phosphate-dependent enzyme [Pseudomonadales bacterium]|nr:aminotransferase class I/II-fold pyridoxal phosphate-dependent enzyme [Pseudomonadales bacterium]